MKKVFLKRASAFAVAVIMLLSGAAFNVFAGDDTEIYENHDIVKLDFESAEVGATEFENVNVAYKSGKNESGSITVVEYGQDKDKVLKYTKVKGGKEIPHYTDLGADTGIKAGSEFVIEMDIMFETAIPNTAIIQGRKEDKNKEPQFMDFLKTNGVGFMVPTTGEMIQKIELWQWYVISIVVNDATREMDIYIDGQLKAENVAFPVEDAKFSNVNNYTCIRALNLTGHSTPVTAYADDISLIYGNEPIYKGEPQNPDDGKTEDDKKEEEEEEEEEIEYLFPAEEIKKPATKESSMLKESDSDKIYLAVLGVLGVGAVVLCTVFKKKEEKAE